MKGHNYGLCRKCGKEHIHPKGMLNKKHALSTLLMYEGRTGWNKGLTKDTDERVKKTAEKCTLQKNNFFTLLKNDPDKYMEIEKDRAKKSRLSRMGLHPNEQTKKKISETLKEGHQTGRIKNKKIVRETRVCFCGCGTEFIVKINSLKKYLHGHNSKGRPSPFKGKKSGPLSESKRLQKAQKLKNNSNWIKACFKKGHIPWNAVDGNIKKKRAWREAVRLGVEKAYITDPTIKEKLRESRLKQVFPTFTSIETAIREGLIKLDYNEIDKEEALNTPIEVFSNNDFVSHYPIKYYETDFCFPKPKIAIFIDGCYWHNCPVHYPQDKKLSCRDSSCNTFLKNRKWTVMRFWGHEVRENVDRCLQKIEEQVLGGENVSS